MALTSNPKRAVLLIALMAPLVILLCGCMGKHDAVQGDERYSVNTDDLNCCVENRGIDGYAGRVLSFYRTEEVKTYIRPGRYHYEISYLYYYILDNAGSDDIEKMRNDRSYVPENYRVYSFYTGDENKKRELDELCAQWTAYMNGSSDTIPGTFYINGRVSSKSFNEYDIGEFKKAAIKSGFAEDQIAPLLIFDDPVSTDMDSASYRLFLIAAAASLLVVWIFLIKIRRNKKGKY